jgi:hypothetical protein
MIPGSANPLLLKSAAAAGALQISRSLRFNSSDSAYLSRTPAVAGNRKTWTYSLWVKKANIIDSGSRAGLLAIGPQAVGSFSLAFSNNASGNADGIIIDRSSVASTISVARFRDVSAWYHILLAVDTTLASNRTKLYVNNTQITDFTASLDSIWGQNVDTEVNSTGQHRIGQFYQNAEYFNGYLTNIHLIDGQALTPSSFTETDATTGQLIPKTYTGSYGTNGFNLLFADNSSNTASTLGKDTSGNGNNWTPNNLSINVGGPTSVAAASGALPIFNTTDTYGAVKGTGTRTDTNASSLSLCVPMGTASGLSLTDEQPTGRVSSSSTLVNTSVTNNTSFSQFYGGSAYFNGTTSQLKTTATSDFLFGTGDFTVEGWFYQASATTYPSVLEIGNHGTGPTGIIFGTSYAGNAYVYSGGFYGAAATSLNTWNHIAWTRASGVLKIFVNGFLLSSVAFTNNLTDSTNGVTVGATHTLIPGYYFPGYMQDLRIYKGVAKYTGNFNPPTSTVNATIAAGNDSLVDSPTNYGTDTGVGGEVRGNYATWNPLALVYNTPSLSNGNLDSASNNSVCVSTIGIPPTGKWYCEVSGTGMTGGICPIPRTVAIEYNIGNGVTGVIGIAVNRDADEVKLYKDNVLQSTTNITSGGISTSTTAFIQSYAGGTLNAGQRAFAYTAPSGFKALCTQNLPTPLVTKSNTVMDVAFYTGNGSTQTISGLAFEPDLVWVKMRSGNDRNILSDVVRGITNVLNSDSTRDEATATEGNQITSVTSTGFTVGSNGNVNQSSSTFVGWCWDAGTSTVSNTQGSITSQVRANASAGFSVVTYTGSSTNNTVGHGLGVTPALVMVKPRTTSDFWVVYHSALNDLSKYLVLNSTAAAGTASNYWGTSGNWSSTTFGVSSGGGGNNNLTGVPTVAYCFAPVVGYSSVGSYVGNGSSDGVFVYTGFRPRWLLVKSTGSGAWIMHDTSRNTYNASVLELQANDSTAEYNTNTFSAGDRFDILSNGFKSRTANSYNNSSGQAYIYLAFAEMPFNYSRAR